MSRQTYAVLGATGKIGSVISETLLAAGHRVRAIGRDTQKLAALRNQGAEAVNASFDDAHELAAAFSGCDGAFTMIAPAYDVEDHSAQQDRAGEAITHAFAHAKVRRVVNLSSIGAHLPDKTGPIAGLHRQEERLNALPGVDVVHLRPCYFMQNFAWSIPTIKSAGIVASAIHGDRAMWMVSTDDIGRKAASLLASVPFKDKSVFEFVGPRQLTPIEATDILGKSLGRELRYVQAAYEDERQAMLAAGMRPRTVDLMVEMHEAFNDGLLEATQKLTDDHRGTTPFEAFAREFARRFPA